MIAQRKGAQQAPNPSQLLPSELIDRCGCLLQLQPSRQPCTRRSFPLCSLAARAYLLPPRPHTLLPPTYTLHAARCMLHAAHCSLQVHRLPDVGHHEGRQGAGRHAARL